MGQGSSLDRAVRAAEAESLARLTELAGGLSMCVIGRSGKSFPAAKYHEGAAAAVSDVRRALAAGDEPSMALAAVRERWEERRSAPTLGGDWTAYNAGALEALEGLERS